MTEERIHYTHCPICGSTHLVELFHAKDHTVSAESFPIVECDSCGLRMTQDVPLPEHIAPYYKSGEYISHTNTSRGVVNRLYHWVRSRTMRRKRRLVSKETGKKRGRLLDVGTGIGTYADEMKRHGWVVTGLEPDADARAVGLKEYGMAIGDIANFYELEAGSFDAITMWHVLEHVHDLKKYVAQLKKLLQPGGRLFIAVPNYTSVDAAVYASNWAAYDVPRHLYHFSPRAMRVLMESAGLRVLACKPMWYDAFYIALLSSRNKHGKTNWVGAIGTGLRSNVVSIFKRRRCSSLIYIIGK